MPLKSGRLTPQEIVFRDAFATTGDKAYAAMKAGYSSPRQSAHKALANPIIEADVRRQQLAILNNELLPAAIGVLATIIADPKASERGKLTAVKIVLDRALGGADASESKEPHEMTSDEIQKRLDALRREASDRTRVVIEHEPGEAKAEPSAFD